MGVTSTPGGFFAPAAAGEVWVLVHSYVHYSEAEVTVHQDAADAVRTLAGRIRTKWQDALRRDESMPGTAPDNDWAAVAAYFARPAHVNTPLWEVFELYKRPIEQGVAPTVAGAPEYALMGPYEQVQCPCGNYPALDGFDYCERDGALVGEGQVSGWLLCGGCQRVIVVATGEVLS